MYCACYLYNTSISFELSITLDFPYLPHFSKYIKLFSSFILGIIISEPLITLCLCTPTDPTCESLPSESLVRKTAPRRNAFRFFISPTILNNLFQPEKNMESLKSSGEYKRQLTRINFDIKSVILLNFSEWQCLVGLMAIRVNFSLGIIGQFLGYDMLVFIFIYCRFMVR